MKFLLVEILICLIAASLLGLVIGWLIRSLVAKRRLASASDEWNDQLINLRTTTTKEISELKESNATLEVDKEALNTKIDSLGAKVKSVEAALLKASEENKALNSTVSTQQQTINEIRVESEKLVSKQSQLQMELAALEKSQQQEIGALNKQLDESDTAGDPMVQSNDSTTQADNAPAPTPNHTSATPGIAPVLTASKSADNTDIDEKIKSLNDQRDRLNREREELFHQEQHFASQLTRGDDTEAYLDQTMRIDPDQTAAIQTGVSELYSSGDETAEPLTAISSSHSNQPTGQSNDADRALFDNARPDPEPQPESKLQTESQTRTPAHVEHKPHRSTQAEAKAQAEQPKTLWNKLKSTISRPTDKTKT